MRPEVKTGGFIYYEYVLCYVDNVIFISDEPIFTMKGIQPKFKLKWDKIDEPNNYPGAELSNMTNVNGKEWWAIYPDNYCAEVSTNVEYVSENHSLRLTSKFVTPIRCVYLQVMDVTREINYYGLQW